MIPTRLITARLSLRPIAITDTAEIFQKWSQHPDVAKYMSWPMSKTVADTQQFVDYAVGAWVTGVEFTWVIAWREAPGLIGSCGLRVRENDADFGYLLLPEFWGQGLITEAMGPIIDWCCAQAQIQKIWATHHVDNPASGRVMAKLGLRYEKTQPKAKIFPQISQTEPQDECLWSWTKNDNG